MLEQKERYVVTLQDGRAYNVYCGTFKECIEAFGEESIRKVEKLDDDMPAEEEGK